MQSLPERILPLTKVEAVPVDDGPRIASAFLAALREREILRAELAAAMKGGW